MGGRGCEGSVNLVQPRRIGSPSRMGSVKLVYPKLIGCPPPGAKPSIPPYIPPFILCSVLQKIKVLALALTAHNLSIISLAMFGLIPGVTASRPGTAPTGTAMYLNMPVNADGSITVKLARQSTMDVNLHEIGGSSVGGMFTRPIGVKIEK